VRLLVAGQIVGVAAALVGLAAGAVLSVRIGWADYWARQETVEGTEKAIRLTPDQSVYYARLAALTADDAPVKSTDALKRAAALNPADAGSWIELGLRAETAGDQRTAEQCLLRAAEEDRQYLPRWTLANYYFRRKDVPRFWAWAKAAATMAHGDAWPLFRLCGRVAEDGKLIDRLDIRNADVRASYVSYLVSQGRSGLIGPAARRVIESGRESDVPVLLAACDRLLAAKATAGALELWNALAEKRRISLAPLDPARGLSLTNGDFSAAPASLGFDWRLPDTKGITAAMEEKPAGLRVSFLGEQPENCEALTQLLPVLEKTDYEFSFTYRTSGISPGTGLWWRVTDGIGSGTLAELESLSSEEETQRSVRFRTPNGCSLIRLALAYRRVSGTTRIEGSIVLRNLRVDAR
jgi:tetratricopeptide (TPR) repeat protein